jgi:hypothetical protein
MEVKDEKEGREVFFFSLFNAAFSHCLLVKWLRGY